MSFSYANPLSGPSAGGIGWFNFGTLTINPGDSITGLTGTLNDGTTVTFDLSCSNISGANRSFIATQPPTWAGTFFGNGYYTGILGNVALYTNYVPSPSNNGVTISNIVVKDAQGNPVPNYTVLVADAESTGLSESWTWTTNGGGWTQFAILGMSTNPTLTGLNTPTATITGNLLSQLPNDYVLATQNPTQLTLATQTTGFGGQQAVAIGFATTRIKLQKNVGQRIDPADQFVLNIAGTPSDQATTTGAADGIQADFASIFAIPGHTYTINESMAPGSANPLTAYTRVLSAANATPAGSIPPLGSLPVNFTAALGDNVTYTILNAAPETFTKSVDKAFADIGDVLTYTVKVYNPNNFPVSNVLVTDPTPAGTTYIGNLIVSAPYTGTSPASGITITAIPAEGTVSLSWQIQINTVPPITTPIANIAAVSIPNGTSGVTNVVTTNVSHALVAINKAADKMFADVGDIITYTLTLNNPGNVAANQVVITDPIPAGTSYVPGSVMANVAFVGDPTTTIKLTAPIPAGGSAMISFQVKVNSATVDQIQNSALAAYTYTVDPNKPNGVVGTRVSNMVMTAVANAKLTIVKSADKTISYLGDMITYQFAVTNTGNVAANQVVLTDILPSGVAYQPGTLSVSVPYTAVPPSSIQLTNPVAPGETVAISFQVMVISMPTINPVLNKSTADYTYTVNPLDPDGVSAEAESNTVSTLIFRYNFSQQITDLIQSVALEQAALAAIANQEGAKIQKMVAMGGITSQELMCLNKSVTEMVESITVLESMLKQKLGAVDCQINSGCI